MIDRSRLSFAVTSTRIRRTDLGDGSVVVDDDALVIVLRAAADDRPFRVPLAAVDGVRVDTGEVALSIHDGTRLTLLCESAAALAEEIDARCRVIPELTRALRAFGSRRGHGSARATGPAEQRRFFAPLLDARRVAVTGEGPDAAVRAFDGDALASAINAALLSFAVERHGENGPARRALEAELVDLAEPLQEALVALREDARDAERATDDLRVWRVWSAQLRKTFEIADRVWLSIDSALDSVPWRE